MDRRQFLKHSARGIGAALAGGAVLPGSSGGEAARPGTEGETPGAGTTGKRPNILYLMTDQHRGDCLGCAGNDAIRTPHLDRIAREGVYFRRGYSSTPTCTPARSALLTGLSPWHHGMLGYGRVADRYPVELPRALREAGYWTLGIGKMHWYPQRHLHGFHRTILDESGRAETKGFESDYRAWFRETAPKGVSPDATGIGWNDYRARPYALPEELHPTSWTAMKAVEFIEGYVKPEPFLLKVSFARPHSPYDPPKRFMDSYAEGDMPPPHVGSWAARHAPVPKGTPPGLWHGDLGLEQARRSRRGYYGSVSFIDENIGKILGALEKRGWLEDTFIIFVADHGDMLGDHHLWRKSYAYEASARIPFIVRPPKGMGIRRGQTIDLPVELRDVLPTFLEVAGHVIPSSHLDGRSLLGPMRGDEKTWREWIDLEHDVCYHRSNHWNALTDGRFKYIYHAQDGEQQLFDLKDDPGECRDLGQAPGKRALVKEWRARLAAHLEERGPPFVVKGDLVLRPERMLYSPHYPRAKKL